MQLDNVMGNKLLKVARNAIDACLMGRIQESFEVNDAALKQLAGCFVTIHKGGQLRGCIGNFISQQPLYLEVAQMAVAAATTDPRFHPMIQDDIGNYKLDISILSPLEEIDDVTIIEVGKHGIYLEQDYSRGVLLPQVASENGWDRQVFIEQTCIKAGLPTDAWKSSRTTIYVFTAQLITDI